MTAGNFPSKILEALDSLLGANGRTLDTEPYWVARRAVKMCSFIYFCSACGTFIPDLSVGWGAQVGTACWNCRNRQLQAPIPSNKRKQTAPKGQKQDKTEFLSSLHRPSTFWWVVSWAKRAVFSTPPILTSCAYLDKLAAWSDNL